MSRFSGRCDVYDALIAIGKYTEEELIHNIKIYVDGGNEPIEIKTVEDIVPYYGYVEAISSYWVEDGKRFAILHIKK